jgi:lysophospholipase L1-like esterase
MTPSNPRITWPTICVFGDSIAWGSSDQEGGGWVDRLKLDLFHQNKASVYNLGVEGDRVGDVLARFEHEAPARSPRTIIFAIGINDLLFDGRDVTPPAQFEAHWLDLLTKASTLTHQIAAVSILNVNEAEGNHGLKNDQIIALNNIIHKVITAEGYAYLNMFATVEPDEFADGLHPNSRGQSNLYSWMSAELEHLGWDK